MRLLSCHIENFGKLSNFSYDFEEGLNVIFEENGWGKSTLAAFLRVMFYGFEGENRRSDIANERSRFHPWGGGIYGGSVTFSCGEDCRRYRVLRTFGLRRKEDSFRLLDDSTGLASDDFSSDLGEELFGIDAESFRRSVFLTQSAQSGVITPATAAIQARIGGLSGEDADMRQYDDASLSVKKEANRLNPDRATGQINKARRQLSSLRAGAAKEPYLSSSYSKQRAQAEDLRRQISMIQKRREALAAGIAQRKAEQETAKASAGQTAEQDPLNASDQRKASRERLRILQRTEQNILTQGRLEREDYQQIRLERRREEQRLQNLHRQKDSAESRRDSGIANHLSGNSGQSRTSGRSSENPGLKARRLTAEGFLSVTAGSILLILTLLSVLPVWFLIIAVALFCCGTGLFLSGKNLQANAHADPHANLNSNLSSDSHANLSSNLNSDLHLHSHSQLYARPRARGRDARSGRKGLSAASESSAAAASDPAANESELRLLRAEEERSRERLQSLSDRLHEVRRKIQIEQRIIEDSRAGDFSGEKSSSPVSPVSDISPGTADYAALVQREQQLQSSLIAVSHSMQETGVELRRCREAAEECRSLEKKISSMEHRYEVLRQTAKYLEQAKISFTSRYRDPFLRAFRKYYTMMTGNSGEDLHADASLNVTVSEGGLPRDPALLSEGNRGLIALCRRMAMVDAMYPGEKPFLVFDDPFASLDDTRMEGGLRFLQSTSSEYQILYLTCHASRVPEWT